MKKKLIMRLATICAATFICQYSGAKPILTQSTNVAHIGNPLQQYAAPAIISDGGVSSCLSVSDFKIAHQKVQTSWFTGTFNIQNTCSRVQNLSGLKLIFSSNNGGKFDAWVFKLDGLSTFTNASAAANVDPTSHNMLIKLLTQGTIAANTSIPATFELIPYAGFKLLDGTALNLAADTPVSGASLNIDVDSSNICKNIGDCHIGVQLTGKNESPVTIATITNSEDKIYPIANLKPDTYTISIANDSLPEGVTDIVSPKSVTLSDKQVSSISVKFSSSLPPSSSGGVSFNIKTPDTNVFTSPIPVTISGTTIVTQNTTLGQNITADNLKPGNYSLSIPKLASALNGEYYSYNAPIKLVIANKVTDFGIITPTADVSPSDTIAETFVVNGLSANDNMTLTFTDNKNNSSYLFNPEIIQSYSDSGVTKVFKFLPDDNVTVSINTGSAYEPIAPFVFNTGNGSSRTETINLVKKPLVSGRIIGYVAGWKPMPNPSDLANAGYTNLLVSFGLLDLAHPGSITPYFNTVTKAGIKSLQDAGMVVSLSIGGANPPYGCNNCSVNFADVANAYLAAHPGPDAIFGFEDAMVSGIQDTVKEYGFDGIDIDLEHGVSVSPLKGSTTSGIEVLAAILDKLYATTTTNSGKKLLISLAPQIPNIAPGNVGGTWAGVGDANGNYSYLISLLKDSHSELSWVGVQLYNNPSVMAINGITYLNEVSGSTDAAVASAVDLLEDWPSHDSYGRGTGYAPYEGSKLLNPNQIVLGYPIPDSNGGHDGSPIEDAGKIKQSINCLENGVCSGSYIPPHKYANIGGVFGWEVSYDADNNFNFAKNLKACVKNGNCNN